jgi:hypothetical protein
LQVPTRFWGKEILKLKKLRSVCSCNSQYIRSSLKKKKYSQYVLGLKKLETITWLVVQNNKVTTISQIRIDKYGLYEIFLFTKCPIWVCPTWCYEKIMYTLVRENKVLMLHKQKNEIIMVYLSLIVQNSIFWHIIYI